MKKGRIEFSITYLENQGEIENQMAMSDYFARQTQIAYFQRPFHYGAKPASEPVSQ